MGDHDDGDPQTFVDVFQKFHNLRIVPEVLPCRRLVQDQHPGIHHQNGSDGHPLFLTKAQSGNRPVPERVEAADFQRFMYPLFDLLLRHAAYRKSQRHLVKNHGLADHLVGILHHQADNLAPFLNGEAGDILSLQKNFPGVRRDEATDQIGKCALSRAVLSHNADHFPFFNSEIDILQNLLPRDVGEA